MKNNIKNILAFILFVLFSSCGVLENDDGSSLSPLDSKIDFKIIESFDDYESVSTPKIFIELQTEKIYECCNYSIRTNYKLKERRIEVDITGIYKSGLCLTSFGAATERIKLGELSGIYEIEIKNRRFNDKYYLLISDSLIILDGRETSNTKPSISFMYRYPKNSFAYICGTTISDSSIYRDFIDTLKSVIDLREFYFSEIAEIPYPKSSSGYQYNAKARYFYYKNEDEFNKIRDVMKNYKVYHKIDGGGVGFYIVNWMNKKIYSWLL